MNTKRLPAGQQEELCVCKHTKTHEHLRGDLHSNTMTKSNQNNSFTLCLLHNSETLRVKMQSQPERQLTDCESADERVIPACDVTGHVYNRVIGHSRVAPELLWTLDHFHVQVFPCEGQLTLQTAAACR